MRLYKKSDLMAMIKKALAITYKSKMKLEQKERNDVSQIKCRLSAQRKSTFISEFKAL